MAEIIQVGEHWAVIEAKEAIGLIDQWTAIWALYPNREEAAAAPLGATVHCLVSGGVGIFSTAEGARARAELDAARTAAVISGTYRD